MKQWLVAPALAAAAVLGAFAPRAFAGSVLEAGLQSPGAEVADGGPTTMHAGYFDPHFGGGVATDGASSALDAGLPDFAANGTGRRGGSPSQPFTFGDGGAARAGIDGDVAPAGPTIGEILRHGSTVHVDSWLERVTFSGSECHAVGRWLAPGGQRGVIEDRRVIAPAVYALAFVMVAGFSLWARHRSKASLATA